MKITNRLLLSVLFALSLLPLYDLIHPGLPVTHDGQDHVIRIANFYQNLTEGNIIPRWSSNVNYGFGHPVLMFFYPLPYYVASLFHFFGFSLTDSTKIVFALAYVLSGYTMYLFIKSLLNKEAGFVAAMLYLFAPYRFVDFYVRGAIGEHVAFLFPPLVLYFLLRLYKKPTHWNFLGGVLSIAGLILSHNAMSLMFLPLIFFFGCFLLWKAKFQRKLLFQYGGILALGFAVAAFFWFPAMFEAKYTLRTIVTAGEYAKRFISFSSLFGGPWSYGGSGMLSVQIGLIHIFLASAAFLSSLVLLKRKNDNSILICGLLLYTILAICMMLPISDILWRNITLLQSFQFPWRFLSIIVFTTAVMGALFYIRLPKKLGYPILLGMGVLLLVSTYPFWKANNFLRENDAYFTRIQRTTTNDTGESSPIWSVRFMETKPKAAIEVISGNAKIKTGKRSITKHSYSVTADNRVQIRENTLYFPGWQVFVDGEKASVEFQDQNNRGVITFFVEEGRHTVEVVFTETKLRVFANLLSVAGVIIVILLYFVPKRWAYGKKNR